MTNGNGRSWTEYFRVITPFLLFVLTIIGGNISTRLNDIDEKLFRHLTNDEVHCPRSLVVTKPEFSMYQTMRDKQMSDFRDLVVQNNANIRERITELTVQVNKFVKTR